MAAAPPQGPSEPFAPVGSLTNRLPGSGGLPLDAKKMRPDVIRVRNQTDAWVRSAHIAGFEGVALDDALNWTEEFCHYGFVPLAAALAEIVRNCGPRKDRFSVLELGCGAGGFRPLLARFGANLYLGLDANPLAFEYSPHILESPASYRIVDLQKMIDFGCTFDVICSFEVLEHIREDALDELMWTIRTHMRSDSLFVGTASTDEHYDVHITVHPREWWLERFARFGLVPVSGEHEWTELLYRSHPHNWGRETSSAFVLRRNDSPE
jgi:SAM-dependent methyltransferase